MTRISRINEKLLCKSSYLMHATYEFNSSIIIISSFQVYIFRCCGHVSSCKKNSLVQPFFTSFMYVCMRVKSEISILKNVPSSRDGIILRVIRYVLFNKKNNLNEIFSKHPVLAKSDKFPHIISL